MPAPRERQPTPVATRPADVSCLSRPASWSLYRIHGRAEVPLKTGNPSPTRISSTTGSRNPGGNGNIRSYSREKGIWPARPSSDADLLAEMAQKDKPEMVPTFAFPARQEAHLENSQINWNPPCHNCISSRIRSLVASTNHYLAEHSFETLLCWKWHQTAWNRMESYLLTCSLDRLYATLAVNQL